MLVDEDDVTEQGSALQPVGVGSCGVVGTLALLALRLTAISAQIAKA